MTIEELTKLLEKHREDVWEMWHRWYLTGHSSAYHHDAKDVEDNEKKIVDEVDRLKAELAKCREALRMVEWTEFGSYADMNACPWCRQYRSDGHAPDCPRQLALESER